MICLIDIYDQSRETNEEDLSVENIQNLVTIDKSWQLESYHAMWVGSVYQDVTADHLGTQLGKDDSETKIIITSYLVGVTDGPGLITS